LSNVEHGKHNKQYKRCKFLQAISQKSYWLIQIQPAVSGSQCGAEEISDQMLLGKHRKAARKAKQPSIAAKAESDHIRLKV